MKAFSLARVAAVVGVAAVVVRVAAVVVRVEVLAQGPLRGPRLDPLLLRDRVPPRGPQLDPILRRGRLRNPAALAGQAASAAQGLEAAAQSPAASVGQVALVVRTGQGLAAQAV